MWGFMNLILVFACGCCPVANPGSPWNGVPCKGTIMLPTSCLAKGSKTVPFSSARIILTGDQGDVVHTETNQDGEWAVSGLVSLYYRLEAFRDNIVIKQVVGIQPGIKNQAGEANAYTTSQVMIYEAANQFFENALYLREVPDLVIPENLVEAVETAYRECRNPFNDPNLIIMVHDLVHHQF